MALSLSYAKNTSLFMKEVVTDDVIGLCAYFYRRNDYYERQR